MFDVFFDEIDKELGSLNPDWFEELTAKASRGEGRPDSSKAENERVKDASVSQLFSTPKIFKQQHCQSPASIHNEDSPHEVNNGDSTPFLWAESSPCLFGSAKDSEKNDKSCEKPRDCFGILDTPKRSLARSAKHISESLGAQINPDLSWTSSFNTPSSLTPTVILPNTEDHVPSGSSLKDKEAIFVRKLFPSLSKASENTATLSDTALKQDAQSETVHESHDLREKPLCSPDASGLWKQKVPSAIEDGDVRSTVQEVLDGAEDVLSIFFNKSTSVVRRIKTKERIRKRINDSSKDVRSVVLTSETEEKLKADIETNSPSKNEDVIQWTPLSLSECVLNESSSSTSLINNDNTVASSETNGGTDFNCAADSSQIFSQGVILRSYPDEAPCQNSLAFTLNRKSRKFVYQVPSSNMLRTGTGHKASLPVCFDQMLTESPSMEKMPGDLNESRFTSENTVNNQSEPQVIKQLSTEPHDVDHGLDMTQLSEAFAEDFTQEIIARGPLDVPAQNDQKSQVQLKAEPEQRNEDANRNDISNLAEISMNSPNKSATMLKTFEISHDSGCPTTFSDLDGTTASCADIKEFFPAFKTANNKPISVSDEAIRKAKASLDEATGDGLSNAMNDHMMESLQKSGSRKCNATRSPVGESIFPNHASKMCFSDAAQTDAPKSFKMNSSNWISPQPNEFDFKNTVSDVGLQKEALLKKKLWRGSDSSKCIHQKVFDSSYKPTAVVSSRDDLEENGTLTASQKADVTELCNLLEEANSQLEFTQFKPTNLGSDKHTTESQWDPDILKDIDFDDSFNCDVKGKHPIMTETSSVNLSDPVQILDAGKRCSTSRETQNEVAFSVTEDDSLVDGMKRKQDVNFICGDVNAHKVMNKQMAGNARKEQNCLPKKTDVCVDSESYFGFSTASGAKLKVSEKALLQARKCLNDVDSLESQTHECALYASGKHDSCISTTNFQKTKAVSWSKIPINQPDSVMINQISDGPNITSFNSENVFHEQKSSNDAKETCANIFPSETFMPHSGQGYGFQTASGKGLSVSAIALKKAQAMFKDCDSNSDHLDSVNIEGKNDKLNVETVQQTNSCVTFSHEESRTVFRDSGLNNPSLQPSLDQQPPQEEVCDQKGLQNEFSNCPPLNANYGFSTASGKKVSISAEALQRAKDVLSEAAESFSSTNGSEKTKQVADIHTDATSSGKLKGFCTASGKKLAVSATGLQRAKNLFRDCEEESLSSEDLQHQNIEDLNSVLEKPLTKHRVAFAGCSNLLFNNEPDSSSSLGENMVFSTACGKKVAISAVSLQRANSLFKDCKEEDQVSKGFSTASGKDFTLSEKSREVKATFAGYDDTSFTCDIKTSSGKNMGFSTAGGKKVSVSATALQRAKSLFKDCEEEDQVSKGFSTASGKGFTVSEKAREVRTAFAESDDTSFSCDLNSSGQNIGFSTAGGKKVPVSSAALERAKNLFKDCEEEHQVCKSFSTASANDFTVPEKAREVSAESDDTSFSCDLNSSRKNIGFSTAGGKKVSVSSAALERAKSLFKECEEEHQVCKSFSTASGKVSTVPEKAREVSALSPGSEDILDGNLKFGFSTASGKGVSVSKVDIQLLQSDSIKGSPQHHDKQDETTLYSSPSKATVCEPAQLDLQSLDFTSCTETQQMYFEQEAMACTKALLADDDLTKSAGLMTSEGTDYKRSSSVPDLRPQEFVDRNRKRKRQLDASSVSDSSQPPLKRQLLSEFDQTVDENSSGLTALKSCPNGTLGDRRVFKYNTNLKPYITGPNRDPVNCYSTVSVQNSDPKGGVFLHPFERGTNTGTSNCQDVSKVSSAFTPPFTKKNNETAYCNNQMDQKMTSHRNSVGEFCDEKSLAEDFKPKSNTFMDRIPLKVMESDKKALREAMQLARDMQNMRLRKKKRQTIRPVPGSLYLAKTSGDSRISLTDAVGCKCPGQYKQEKLNEHGLHHKVSEVTSENAESFRFDCNDFFRHELLMESGALQLADGGWLVPDSNGTVGKEEFYSALCDTPGVDPKLISDAWVFNHYRWIVWKRASMERAFPDLMGNLCLTPEQVLLQLKLRYDVEVDHSQRSALRKIMERDDTPAKTLVLCVCGVVQTCENAEKPVKSNAKMESCVIWLTDGWYDIKGLLDPPLSAMLNKGRLQIGDKIVTSGAELVGSQEACPPLEAPESLMLKISANSTRRARWDTKLGYYRDPRPISLQLSSLYSSGGVVSCVNIMVLRSYPTQWMEKKPNSVCIFRNDRAEDREARKHSTSKHKSMDLLISKMQTQFEKEMEGKTRNRGKRKSFSRHEIEALLDGEDLYEAMEQDSAVESHLSERQREAVNKYRHFLEEKRRAELQERVQKAVMDAQEAEGTCPSRDVTPVWKLSITDANDLQSNCVYTLNIWRPSQDLYGLLKEGHRYRAYHLATSEGKRSGIAQVQLTATKKTLFQDTEVSPEWLHQHFRARECVRFKELQNPHFTSPCGEVDIVGYIVSIVGKQGHCPVLHLVDDNFDLVSVRTYSSLEQLAVEELVKSRALVAISNLQIRLLSGPLPCLYAGEQALFSVNPKEPHLREAMAHLKTFVQTCEQFFSIVEEKLSDVVPSGVSGCFQSPRTPGVPPSSKTNGMITPQQKSSIFSPFTPLNSRSPASASTSERKDPKSLKRRRGLEYLSRIPSPPPITPLKTRASPSINKTFNPPRRSMTPKPPPPESPQALRPPPGGDTWVCDEELAMIDTQALVDGLKEV